MRPGLLPAEPLSLSLLLAPDFLQCLAKLPLAQGSYQLALAKKRADPANLKTAKGKGNQAQLQVSPVQRFHFGCACASCCQIRSKDCLT